MRLTKNKIAQVLSIALIFAFLVPGAVGAAEAPATMTLEEAVSRALNNDSSIKTAVMNVDKSEFQDQMAADAWTNLVGNGRYTDAMLYQTMTAAMNSRLSHDSSLKAVQTAREKIENNTQKLYMNVKSADRDLVLAQLDYNITQRQMSQAQLFYQNGLASNSSLIMMEAQFEMKKKDLESKKIDLDQAYYDFNRQVRLPLDSRYQLIDEIAYAPVGNIDIDYHITRLMEESPDLWQAEQALKVAEMSLTAAAYGENNQYRVQEITLNQNRMTVADGKKSFTDSMRSLYATLLKLEGNYATLEQALKVAEEDYRIAVLKYELGMITPIDLLSKEQAYEKAKGGLTSMIYSYQSAKMAFEKPWAA